MRSPKSCSRAACQLAQAQLRSQESKLSQTEAAFGIAAARYITEIGIGTDSLPWPEQIEAQKQRWLTQAAAQDKNATT